jgi:hypothetical protein
MSTRATVGALTRGVVDPLHKGGAVVLEVLLHLRGAHHVHPVHVHRILPPLRGRLHLLALLVQVCG